MSLLYDIVIVGAGAAGVGMGVTLCDLGLENFVILDRHGVGASFARWPKQMRFISPSFMSNGFGLLDLNAVTHTTSPAFTLGSEHPSGPEYAHYLRAVADHYQLPVQSGVDVASVQPVDAAGVACDPAQADGFRLNTSVGALRSRFVIWAAGEFQYPNYDVVPGGEMCIHNATVPDWTAVAGDDFIIIGGYESGIDVAVNLVKLGKRVRVLDEFAPWDFQAPDPSLVLSPYTIERLRAIHASGNLELMEATVARVEENGSGYIVKTADGQALHTPVQPILATGFTGSLALISELLSWHPEHYYARLTTEDESLKTPGLFLSGPFVRHDNLIFCFIYKFRQRFAVVANAIGQRLNLDTTVLDSYRQHNMYLDDLSCCSDECEIC